jgi:hypothetical protein
MKQIAKIMIKKYALQRLKYDSMGYSFDNVSALPYHHLIIPHHTCKDLELGHGFTEWNGAILVKNTSHSYLHVIENNDRDMFDAITDEIIDENIKGYLDIDNLKKIDDILNCFEREYIDAKNRQGEYIIKEEYTRRLTFLDD